MSHPTSTARCIHCRHLVAAEGVTIPADLDLPEDENTPDERCQDSACVSHNVVTVDGNRLVVVRAA